MTSKDRAREKSARMRLDQQRKERRRRNTIFTVATLAGVAVIGGLTVVGLRGTSSQASIEGLSTFTGLASSHVPTPVSYPQSPPVGGDHAAQWQNCGWYDDPVANENAVHSMEHGAVWVAYRSSLGLVQQTDLKSRLDGKAYVLASAVPELSTPVVASAWGAQVALSGPDDPRLDDFLTRYANSRTAPEPGGECSGGVGSPS